MFPRPALCPAVFVVLILGASPVGAQRAGVVLALPASARAAGAGDAAPLAAGASALFYGSQNLPAERAVSASAGTWIGDAQFSTAAVSLPVRRGVAAALGAQSLDYGSADEVVPDPLTGGTRGTATGGRVGSSELAVTAGLAARSRRARIGVSFAWLHQQVANLSGTTLAMSQGYGVTLHGWDVTLTQQHAGKSITLGATTSSLAWTHRASLLTPALAIGRWRWAGVAEWRNVRGEGSTSLLGAEGTFDTGAGWRLAVRGAAASQSDQTARAPWSAGGSAVHGGWSLDYAYQGFGALGVVHRMGVTWRSRGPRSPSR